MLPRILSPAADMAHRSRAVVPDESSLIQQDSAGACRGCGQRAIDGRERHAEPRRGRRRATRHLGAGEAGAAALGVVGYDLDLQEGRTDAWYIEMGMARRTL